MGQTTAPHKASLETETAVPSQSQAVAAQMNLLDAIAECTLEITGTYAYLNQNVSI